MIASGHRMAMRSFAGEGARHRSVVAACSSASSSATSRVMAIVRPRQPAAAVVPLARRDVRAAFFKFGKNGVGAEAAGIVGSQGRDEFSYDDLEAYFNYMGFLADEGNYDRMYKISEGRHPIDAILILAAAAGDFPKTEELLKSGADVNVEDPSGKTPLELCTKEEVRKLLIAAAAAKGKVAA